MPGHPKLAGSGITAKPPPDVEELRIVPGEPRLAEPPPQPYVEGPTPWTSFVPGVYRTSLSLCLRMSHEVMRNPWPVGLTTISLICNVQSLIHMDSHNDDQTCNLILPFSFMEEASCGWNTMRVISNDDRWSFRHIAQHSGAGDFSTKEAACNNAMDGATLQLIAYHVRQAERIPRHDVQYLTQLGFVPREDAFWADELPSP